MKMSGAARKNSFPHPAPVVHEDEHEEHPRKQAHVAEPDEEPWLVSYADMMTLLFGFFVLLYSFAAAKEGTKAFESIKQQMAEQFGGKYVTVDVKDIAKTAPMVTSSSFSSDWEIGTTKNEGEGKKDLFKKRGLRELSWSKATPYKELQLILPVEKLFEPSGEALSAAGRARVARLAGEFLQKGKSDKMVVEVHGGPVRASSLDALRISSLQAAVIMGELVASGISAGDLTVGGYGDLMTRNTDAQALQARGLEKNTRERLVIFRIQEFLSPAKPEKGKE
jgi:chemotaxis protein MotB